MEVGIIIAAAAYLGIRLSAEVIGFISEQRSEKDRIEYESLLEKYIHQCEEKGKLTSKNISEKEKSLSAERKGEYEKLYAQMTSEERREANKAMIPSIKSAVERRKTDLASIQTGIKDALDNLRKNEKQHNTAIRKNSFRLLRDELNEAKNKAFAYSSYLDKYINLIDKICSLNENWEELIFSATLPARYPYNGRLLTVSKGKDFDGSGKGKLVYHKCIELNFVITDYDYYMDMPVDSYTVYVDFDAASKRRVFSIQLGSYKKVSQLGGFGGIMAKTEAYLPDNTIKLIFGKNMELFLKPKNLYNFNRFPPIGSEITVFPYQEIPDTKQKKMIYYVSERQEDSEVSLHFYEIPIIVPENKLMGFAQYWHDNNIPRSFDDAKIIPLSESGKDIVSPSIVMIQFGESFTMIARIETSDKNDHTLWFEAFTENRTLDSNDIYIPFSADINVISGAETEKYMADDVYDNMNNLILTVYKEFKIQYNLKHSQDGMHYFAVWDNVIGALEKYMQKGLEFECELVNELPKQKLIPNKGIVLIFNVKNTEELKQYYEKLLTLQDNFNYACEFITEYNRTYYVTEVTPNCEQIRVIIPNSDLENENNIIEDMSVFEKINIYQKCYPAAERRQLKALYSFKVGNLANPIMQSYMLNSSTVQAETAAHAPLELYNCSIADNMSQMDSLEKSYREKNIFFIQGPPGTGKTTVIRELIAQTVKQNDKAKILIVSQANVAVDNVLKGLLKNMPFTKSDIIRCGRAGKIAQEIADMSYETKYRNYISVIENIAETKTYSEKVRKIAADWVTIIKQVNGYNPDIGELIIKDHKIIGATCVGLAQKGIGIDRIEFDLVIIDEAGKALASELTIPLIQAKKAVIIGDHRQLPAVINPALYDEEKIELDERQYCKKEIFDISYFQRLYEACPDTNKTILDTQYRMPGVIGTLISNLFYEGELKNGVGEKEPLLYGKNLNIVDMSAESRYREDDKNSPNNAFEAEYTVYLLKKINDKYNGTQKVAVITPYKGQKKLLRSMLINSGINYSESNIFIDTVDSFQGDEADIVIYCTTRAKKKTRFLSDKRRLNVALSRTRNEFIMLASVKYLNTYADSEPIKKICRYIEQHGQILKPDKISDQKTHAFEVCKEIISISSLILEQSRFEFDNEFYTKVQKETDEYYAKGRFSYYPKVKKSSSGDFELLNGEEIYYAAKNMSLTELIVDVAETMSANDTAEYTKQILPIKA